MRATSQPFQGATAFLRLLQLTSPAFPTGAFAYSQGLETAVERGWASDVSSLREWLLGVLECSLARTDLPLIALGCTVWDAVPTGELTDQEATAAVVSLSARVLATRETRELREEERQVGRALARVLASQGLAEASFFKGHAQASFIVLYALALSRWRLSVTDGLAAFCFAWLENQLAAASRLMRLGQLDAQSVLAEIMVEIPALCLGSLAVTPEDIGGTLPAHALASSLHEQQYSRLFRS